MNSKKDAKVNVFKPNEFEIIVKHLQESHRISKHPLFLRDKYASAVISHKMIIKTKVNDCVTMESEIKFLPVVRRYRNEEIVEDENLMYEVLEIKEEP